MSASRKLLVAAVLISAGLGVAFLLGEPVSIPQALLEPGAGVQAQVAFPGAAEAGSTANQTPSRVQLLPEAAVAQKPVNASDASLFQSQAFPSQAVPFGSTATATAPPIPASTFAMGNAAPPLSEPAPINTPASVAAMPRAIASAPTAKLRNEAPRPVGSDPRSPATIRRTPTTLPDFVDAGRPADPYKNMASWSASPQVQSTGFTPDIKPLPPIGTAYDAPPPVPANQAIPANLSTPSAPPTWADIDAADEAENHIVVDGDSLERLAARYLDDPQRGGEIYNLNREVLSNPDVLPIGVELKIPDRTGHTSWDRQGRQPGITSQSSVRAAASGNLVPVRPMPSYEQVTPRAQLATPIAPPYGSH